MFQALNECEVADSDLFKKSLQKIHSDNLVNSSAYFPFEDCGEGLTWRAGFKSKNCGFNYAAHDHGQPSSQ